MPDFKEFIGKIEFSNKELTAKNIENSQQELIELIDPYEELYHMVEKDKHLYNKDNILSKLNDIFSSYLLENNVNIVDYDKIQLIDGEVVGIIELTDGRMLLFKGQKIMDKIDGISVRRFREIFEKDNQIAGVFLKKTECPEGAPFMIPLEFPFEGDRIIWKVNGKQINNHFVSFFKRDGYTILKAETDKGLILVINDEVFDSFNGYFIRQILKVLVIGGKLVIRIRLENGFEGVFIYGDKFINTIDNNKIKKVQFMEQIHGELIFVAELENKCYAIYKNGKIVDNIDGQKITYFELDFFRLNTSEVGGKVIVGFKNGQKSKFDTMHFFEKIL